MAWSYATPTKPGFYYWQGGRLTENQVAIVQVRAFRDSNIPLEAEELCTAQYGGRQFKNAPATGPVAFWGGRWAGPIPQPHEF